MKNFHKKLKKILSDWLSIRNITWMTALVFVFMLIPMFWCSFVNRASGDDYGYSALTRAAWISTHSLIAVAKAACETIKMYYLTWQGTWFSIFLFTLQPEIFGENAYVIVAFIMLFFWISSTFLLFRKLLKDKLKFDNLSTNLLIFLFLIISISFIPGKKSAIFWYNGCAHYMIPFVMCQMVVYWLLQYGENYKKRYLIGIVIFMTLLGGANYQAALFGLIVVIYFGVSNYVLNKDNRTFWLVIPFVFETIGLVVSMKAPGNVVRGGEEFGFSISRVVSTVLMSFVVGIKDIGYYLQTYPMVFVGLIVMFLIMLEAVKRRRDIQKIRCPIILVLSMFCLYSAMQAPEIYAGVEVSSGVYNTNFQIFMIMMSLILVVLSEKTGVFLSEHFSGIWNEMYTRIVVPGLFVCVILAFLCRGDIKETTTYICVEYIATGQAADYKEQMEQLTELMTDDEVQDVVVPFINDIQGPLMHMPVTEEPTAWTNTVICQYYGKNSVVAIPRPEWEEKYQ